MAWASGVEAVAQTYIGTESASIASMATGPPAQAVSVAGGTSVTTAPATKSPTASQPAMSSSSSVKA